MTTSMQHSDMEKLYQVIHALYSDDPSIPHNEKQAASIWLNDFQKSVHAWELSDKLLHQKADLRSCYFAAHTLRTKIQTSFHELPVEAHISLRDSLFQHIGAITGTTDQVIATQLCLAVTHLILQANSWADPIGHLLNTFGIDPSHWWPILEILTLLPEEVHSRKLQLGENRRSQVTAQLESVAPSVLTFLKHSLNVCVNTPPDSKVIPVELCLISIVKCFGSWVLVNPQCFFTNRESGAVDVMNFIMGSLSDGKCPVKLHVAASDSICAVSEVVPDLDGSSNNNASELQHFQMMLHASIMNFSEAYAYAVAEEDVDKILNYCRIFTEYGENMVSYMLRSSREPHYSIQVVDKILDCIGHHDYEVAENTFGFWYRLTEDLYHAHDDPLNQLFLPFAQRLVSAMYKHVHIEPDHEGPLNSSDEFYEFRRKGAEIVEDIMFIVGSLTTFQQLAHSFMTETSWDAQEAALYLLYHVSKTIDPVQSTAVVKPFFEEILKITEWRHICLKISAIRFLGGMAEWLNRNPDENLEKTLSFLVACLPSPECSNAAAVALQNICQRCADHIASKYIESLLGILGQMDRYNVSNEAVVGLLKGVGHVVGSLPHEQLATVIRQICWAQTQPLIEICEQKSTTYEKGTKSDPIFWVDRLSAIFRNPMVPDRDGFVMEHPCSVAICQDLWPAISKVLDKYQADPRVMERVSRCIRYAVRCVGKHSHPFVEPLVTQLVSIYNAHHHSCLLYLGSILVDEYGREEQCVNGLLNMLAMFVPSTFAILNQPDGLRNHPDTVDDFFRLCARFLQRCPLPTLKSEVIIPLVQCATQATQLDHRDANISVMKFLFDLAHAGRKHKDSVDFPERQALVKRILLQTTPQLLYMLIYGVIFNLPTYTIGDICELIYELKEVMPQEAPQWLEDALKKLPNHTMVGGQTATLEQLQTYHEQAIKAQSSKELSRVTKDFCRFYR